MNKKAKKNQESDFLTFFQDQKKGDASMWWIIIGAVIALVVLIILMIIFTGKTNKLEGGLSECLGKGGVCAPSIGLCPKYTLESSAFTCTTSSGEKKKCCIGTPKKATNGACDSEEILNSDGYCYPTS